MERKRRIISISRSWPMASSQRGSMAMDLESMGTPFESEHLSTVVRKTVSSILIWCIGGLCGVLACGPFARKRRIPFCRRSHHCPTWNLLLRVMLLTGQVAHGATGDAQKYLGTGLTAFAGEGLVLGTGALVSTYFPAYVEFNTINKDVYVVSTSGHSRFRPQGCVGPRSRLHTHR